MSGPAVPEPAPVRDLDDQLAGGRGLHRARWAATGAVAAVVIAALVILGLLVMRQQTQLRASCAFWATLTNLPVQPVPPATAPSKLAVSIVSGARTAYLGEDCGKLPPPSASFTRWAHFYGLPDS